MTLATFPKMPELGNVRVPGWRAVPSTQVPVASRITNRWHLVTASLPLGRLRAVRPRPVRPAGFEEPGEGEAAPDRRGRWALGPVAWCGVREPALRPGP